MSSYGTSYAGGPKRINTVSIMLVLLALAAGYLLWRFFPVYFDGWTVEHILKDAANQTYRVARIAEPERTKQLKLIVDKARAEIVRLGHVEDPDLTVDLDLDGNEVAVSAEYRVVVTHPGIDKTTTLHFHKHEKASVKRVEWE
jgi:hypothetical protein